MMTLWLSAGWAEPSPNSFVVWVCPKASVQDGMTNSAKTDVVRTAAIPVTRS
jgi:hypothetical protein